MTKKKTQKQEQENEKKKRRGLLAGLLLFGAAAATGIGLTVYYATRPVVQTYTVTIKNVEGATICGGTTQKVIAGTLVGQLPIPYKDDMVFYRWQTYQHRPIDNNKPINEDMTVYAAWTTPTMDAHTVTFELDGGTLPGITGNSIKVNDGTLVGKLPSPIKDGYVFDKWQWNGIDLPFTYEITSSITISAVYKTVASGVTISGGSRLLEFKTGEAGSDTPNKWVLKNGTTEIQSPTWTIVNKATGSAISGLTMRSDGIVEWSNVPVGSYTAVITGKKDAITASSEIGIVVTEHSYTLSGGSTQLTKKFGLGGSDTNTWALKEGTTTVTSGITWSVTGADGTTSVSGSGITINNGKLSWTAATPKDNYDLMVHAKVGTIDTTVRVGLIIADNEYRLIGGTRGFNVKPSDVITDSEKWNLYKDETVVASPNLSIKNTPTELSGKITISTGQVKLNKIPEGEWTFDIVATDNGKTVASQTVSVFSTETYSIVYGTGYIGTSLTIKDNVTTATTDTNGFTLNASGGAVTSNLTWDVARPASLDPSQISFSTSTGDTNKLVYGNGKSIPAGTYSLVINAKINNVVKASIPFTLVSKSTKIAVVINGPDSLNVSDKTHTFTTNVTGDTVTWSIPTTGGWTGPTGTCPTIESTTGKVTIASTNLSCEGTLTIEASDSASGQKATKAVAIRAPYRDSNQIWSFHTYSGEGAKPEWSSILMNDLIATSGNITITGIGGTQTASVGRTAFDTNIYIGENVTTINDKFLNGCTSFNSSLLFDGTSQCLVIGNDFMSGCSSFNKTLKLPNTVKIIGNNFLDGCTVFDNGWTTGVAIPFEMPTSLTDVGDMFMYECKAFNQTLTLAATISHIGESFMYNCYNMQSAVTINCDPMCFKAEAATPLSFASDDYTKACYNPGIIIKIATDQVDNFKSLFPDISATSTPAVCRKIIYNPA